MLPFMKKKSLYPQQRGDTAQEPRPRKDLAQFFYVNKKILIFLSFFFWYLCLQHEDNLNPVSRAYK